MAIAGWTNINLTTIVKPIPEIVAAYVDLITSMLQYANRPPEAGSFVCEIIERQTVRPLPVAAFLSEPGSTPMD